MIGLEFAHSRDVFHQDIKPENVFLMKDGSLKIGDLGISKVLVSADGRTQTQIAGTKYYKPPEAFKGQKVSGKSDIWASGCLIHEAATGCITWKGVENNNE